VFDNRQCMVVIDVVRVYSIFSSSCIN